MAAEIIQTNVGVEQEVILPFGSDTLRLVFQFDDYAVAWYMNIINEGLKATIANGIGLTVGNDAFFGLGLKYGSLALIDTDPTNPLAINLKADFGNRLKLVRDLDA